MANFFDRMLGRNAKESSSEIAKNRLQVVLVHDRINLPPERLREMKEELLAVIAKYVPVDAGSVDIAIEQPDRQSSKIVAQIPFGKGKITLESRWQDYTEDDDLSEDVNRDSPTEAALPTAAESTAPAPEEAPPPKEEP
jgi:cell division topological specificity factor